MCWERSGKGYQIAIETLNEGRIGIGAQMLGLAQGAWNHAARYAMERKQFGKRLRSFRAVLFQLGGDRDRDRGHAIDGIQRARFKDCGLDFVKEAAMCKYFASQVAERVASKAVEIYGGYGFVKDYPVEKLYRDAKIGKIYEGHIQYAAADHRQAASESSQVAGNSLPGIRRCESPA